jgi:hypothetical protein
MLDSRTPQYIARVGFIAAVTLSAGAALAIAQSAPANQQPVPGTGVTTRGPAASVPATGLGTPADSSVVSRVPQRETLLRMQRPITITFNETRLEDVMKFIQEITRADIEPMWTDERNSSGLEKERAITFTQEKGTALMLLEKVLEKATSDVTGGGNTWQLSELGTLQVGPRDRLNKFKRLELYPVSDLLMEFARNNDAPEFDLDSVLQSGNGGGGGQSPFQDNQDDEEVNPQRKQEKAAELQTLITTLVEPDQWSDNGGEAATVRFFQNSFLVTAPDYIHRQINGYPYWPATATRVVQAKGRRYVTLGIDTATSQLRGIENQEVTGPK